MSRLNTMLVAGAVLAATFSAGQAQAAALIVSGDEWQLSNNAYGLQNAGTSALVAGIASEFGGTNYLLLTGNTTYVPQSNLTSLASQLSGLGKTVTFASALPGSLAGYDAVFHFGQVLGSANDVATLLTGYLGSGGSFYASLGSGYFGGTASGEAAYWNPVLADYGLVAGGGNWFSIPSFDTADTTFAPSGATRIVWGYGQTIDPISGGDGAAYVRGTFASMPALGERGLLGISRLSSAVPEPATWMMMILGFGGIGAAMRRRSAAVRVTYA